MKTLLTGFATDQSAASRSDRDFDKAMRIMLRELISRMAMQDLARHFDGLLGDPVSLFCPPLGGRGLPKKMRSSLSR
jgi:hypothetical protein